MHYRTALRVLALLLVIFSPTMLPPLALSLAVGDGQHASFAIAFVLILAAGAALWLAVRHGKSALRTRDGFLVVTLLWLGVATAGALPLMIGKAPHMSFTDAVFESMSGLTTTGATVLSGIDDLPMSVRYYRQQLNWLGGMGIVVLAVAVLPMLGVGGMQLYKAEVPGPEKDKLTPRVADTAKALWLIYLLLTLGCAAAYWAGGMSLFDAIGHSFSTLSTGGFSTHDASLAYFDSPFIDYVGSTFMFLSAVNYALHYVSWRQRSLRVYWRDPECHFYLLLLLAVLAVVCATLLATEAMGAGEALRHGLFQLLTFSTNTGLATTAYYQWTPALLVVLMAMSVIGGMAGSTAGGIKTVRVLLLRKQGWREVLRLIHPRMILPVRLGGNAVSDEVVSAVWGFFVVYMGVFALFLLLLMATGLDQVTSLSAVVATINNLGIGIAGVSGGFAGITDFGKWVLVLSMLMGRLEVFTVLVLFFPAFWRR